MRLTEAGKNLLTTTRQWAAGSPHPPPAEVPAPPPAEVATLSTAAQEKPKGDPPQTHTPAPAPTPPAPTAPPNNPTTLFMEDEAPHGPLAGLRDYAATLKADAHAVLHNHDYPLSLRIGVALDDATGHVMYPEEAHKRHAQRGASPLPDSVSGAVYAGLTGDPLTVGLTALYITTEKAAHHVENWVNERQQADP